MKVSVLQENFHKALSFVGKTVSTKTQLPVLSNVLLETEGGKLKISTTNLETTTTYWIGATIEREGAITVPFRLLAELVASFLHEKVGLVVEDLNLKLQCGTSEAGISGISAKEFPPLPAAGKQKDADISTKELSEGLAFVSIAASNDEGRPLLTGVRFTKGESGVTLVATDGYRLSLKTITQVVGIKENFVVPARALSEVVRAAVEEKAETFDLYFSKERNQVIFLLPSTQIATRLITGEYPAYGKIIPGSFLTQVTFAKEDLLRAVKLAAIYARESSNIIKLDIKDGVVAVSANTPQIGENKTTLDVKKKGDDGEIAFNARFLLDLFNVFPEDEVVFEMSGPLAPGVFHPAKDTSFLHIIMPVRLQN